MKRDLSPAVRRKYWLIWNLTQFDPAYKKMLEEMRVLEDRYFAVVDKLPEEDMETIADFVGLCESMNIRMLEVACEMMDFS